jgi:WD40 repeat protein
VDGALFALLNGTQPHLIIAIEDHAQPAGFSYGLARLSPSDLSIKLEDREVWSPTAVVKSQPQDPYWRHTIDVVKPISPAVTLHGHRGQVWFALWSPDGARLATGGDDQIVRLWKLGGGPLQVKFEGHSNVITCGAFAPDGKLLATGSIDATVKIWDVESGQQVATLKEHVGGVLAVAFSPDGKKLVSAGKDRTVKLWNLEAGPAQVKDPQVLSGHQDEVTGVAFSPNGSLIATAGAEHDRTVRLWDVKTGKEAAVLSGHVGTIWNVVFSPDGKLLASASADGSVRVWDVESRKERAKLEHPSKGPLRSLAFSVDGQKLATGAMDGSVRLWVLNPNGVPNPDAYAEDETPEPLFRERAVLQGHKDLVSSLRFSTDGSSLVSASKDETVNLWDVSDGMGTPPAPMPGGM